MTHPTDEELDALVAAINHSTRDPETGDDLYPGVYVHLAVEDAIAASVAITALRAQIAEAQAELSRRVDMHECAMAERDDATLYGVEQKARADRAEARLAAVIEHRRIKPIGTAPEDIAILVAPEHASADDWQVSWWMTGEGRWANWNWSTLPHEWAPMPARLDDHDRIALDRMLAEASEKALRAADGALETIRVQTGLIRSGCGGVQERLNICCDRIDAAVDMIKGGK